MDELPAPEGGQPERVVPFHALMNEATAETFKTLVAVEQVNGNEILRRAIGTYAFLKEVEFRGGKVYAQERWGPLKELFIGSNTPPRPRERLKNIAKHVRRLLF